MEKEGEEIATAIISPAGPKASRASSPSPVPIRSVSLGPSRSHLDQLDAREIGIRVSCPPLFILWSISSG